MLACDRICCLDLLPVSWKPSFEMAAAVGTVVDTSATDAVTADGADIVVAIHIASGG